MGQKRNQAASCNRLSQKNHATSWDKQKLPNLSRQKIKFSMGPIVSKLVPKAQNCSKREKGIGNLEFGNISAPIDDIHCFKAVDNTLLEISEKVGEHKVKMS